MIRKFSRLHPFERSVIGGVMAFVGYGLWAYWANYAHGMSLALRAAWTQGGNSFVLTFVTTLFIESVYDVLSKWGLKERLLTAWCTIIIVCISIYSASWWVHIAAGTPEIFRTVFPGFIIGGVYTIVYVFGLRKNIGANKTDG